MEKNEKNKLPIVPPVIRRIKDTKKALFNLEQELNDGIDETERDVILDYPTVYIHNYTSSGEYEVYVGESYDIIKRTLQHLDASNDKGNWQKMLKKKNASLFIIGHEYFNKSLTLDVENRLILYMSSVEKVRKIYNRRGNPQKNYYPSSEFKTIFGDIWKELGNQDPELFPKERLILDSAIYKASPFHELTKDQKWAKKVILEKVQEALKQNRQGQIVFVSGGTGTGKTVLNSNLFYDLCTHYRGENGERLKCYLLVNHDQQLIVYDQIAKKLNLEREEKPVVYKPTVYLNRHEENDLADVILVDEAHLLWTQGKQDYQGKNQLLDIQKRAKVVVVMFDIDQILRTEQYWEDSLLQDLENQARANDSYIELKEQLRIRAGKKTIEWIHKFTKEQRIVKIPKDGEGYEIKIFDTPSQLQKEIADKARDEKSGLSRMVATFDWDYKDKKKPDQMRKYWEVSIGEWKMPWNKQIPADPKKRRKNKKLSWAEQEQTINEVGSTFTVQGFDLNYVGVILGPSVKYRDGKIVFDPQCSKNEKATRNRTLSDGTKQKFGETFIKNEVNVLMTRGVDGLYIYAQDPKLREALKKAKENDENE